MYESQAKSGFIITVTHYKVRRQICTSRRTNAAAYLASDRVTVYSNHRMLGIKLVSRTKKYSEMGLLNHIVIQYKHQKRMTICVAIKN